MLTSVFDPLKVRLSMWHKGSGCSAALEDEGPQGVELHRNQRRQVRRVMSVEELHALHQQSPEELLLECRQNLHQEDGNCQRVLARQDHL